MEVSTRCAPFLITSRRRRIFVRTYSTLGGFSEWTRKNRRHLRKSASRPVQSTVDSPNTPFFYKISFRIDPHRADFRAGSDIDRWGNTKNPRRGRPLDRQTKTRSDRREAKGSTAIAGMRREAVNPTRNLSINRTLEPRRGEGDRSESERNGRPAHRHSTERSGGQPGSADEARTEGGRALAPTRRRHGCRRRGGASPTRPEGA